MKTVMRRLVQSLGLFHITLMVKKKSEQVIFTLQPDSGWSVPEGVCRKNSF